MLYVILGMILHSVTEAESRVIRNLKSILDDINILIQNYYADLRQANFYATKNPRDFSIFVDHINHIITKLNKIKSIVENVIRLTNRCRAKFMDQMVTYQRLVVLTNKNTFDILDTIFALAKETEKITKNLLNTNNFKKFKEGT